MPVSEVSPGGDLPTCRCPQVWHGRRVWYHPDWQQAFANLTLTDVRNWREPCAVPSISHSRRAVACYRLTLDDGRVVYYKRYDYLGRWRAMLPFWLRPGKAAIEKWGYRRYQANGVEVPNLVAFGESRVFGLLQSSFIATEEVAGAVQLDTFVAEHLADMDSEKRVAAMSAFARRLIRQIRAAHADRLYHYDLKWRNILVRREGDAFYPVIIDCPRSFSTRLRWRYGVTADFSALARLALSYLTLSQRYRFLASCLGETAGAKERKYWFRRIQKRLEKRPPAIIPLQESPLKGVRFTG